MREPCLAGFRSYWLVLELMGDSQVVSSHTIQLVDESDEGYIVSLHLTIDRDRLTLNTANSAEDQNGAV